MLSTVTSLSGHHHHPTPGLLLSCKTETLCSLITSPPFPLPQPLTTTTYGLFLWSDGSRSLTRVESEYLSFCDWLISLGMCQNFLLFLRLNNIPLDGWTRHLGCLYLLMIVSNAAVNTGMQISLQDPAFNSFAEVGLLVECFCLLFTKINISAEPHFMGQAHRSWLGSKGSLSQVRLPEWQGVCVCSLEVHIHF